MKKLLVSTVAALFTVLAFGLATTGSAAADEDHGFTFACFGPETSVTLYWTPAADAINQWVEVSATSDFETIKQQGPLAASASGVTYNHLNSGVMYYWRVKYSTSGGYEYSDVYSFTACEGLPFYVPVYAGCNPYYGYYPGYEIPTYAENPYFYFSAYAKYQRALVGGYWYGGYPYYGYGYGYYPSFYNYYAYNYGYSPYYYGYGYGCGYWDDGD